MAVVNVLNHKAEKVSQVELMDDIFGVSIKPEILHQDGEPCQDDISCSIFGRLS